MNQAFLNYIKKLKSDHGLRITDCHVHPLDVMGVVHHDDYARKENGFLSTDGRERNRDHLKPSSMEKFQFSNFSLRLSKIFFKYFQKFVIEEIRSVYNNSGERVLLNEMDKAMVDDIFLLALEPWNETVMVKKYFNNKRFRLLGSFDVHKIKIDEIEPRMKIYVEELGVVGLKLHPNLQNFKPIPGQNSPDIAAKLRLIYRLADENNLLLLFHAGLSSYTEYINDKYADHGRSRNNAVLDNFFNDGGESELFAQYRNPIIIAHLGHFGQTNINEALVNTIVNKYPNVYFDTAAVSPQMIRRFIEMAGSKRIILGSDAMYNKMIWSIYFVYHAAKSAKTKENFDDIMKNIISENIKRILWKE